MRCKVLISFTIVLGLSLTGTCKSFASEMDSAQFIKLLELAKENSVNNTNLSIDYAKKALVLAQKADANNFIGSAYNALGIIYEIRGNLDSSVHYYEKSAEAFQKEGDLYFVNSIKINLSQQYFELGRVLDAIEMATEAKEMLDSLGIKSAMMVARSKLAFFCFQTRDYHEGISYRLEELELAEELKDTHNILNVYVGLGYIYHQLLNNDSANFYIQKAYSVINQFMSVANLVQLKKLETMLLINTGEYEDAIIKAHEAKALNKSINNRNHDVTLNSYLAEGFINIKNIDSARYYCTLIEEELPNIKGFDNKRMKTEILYSLTQFYELTKDYEKAYQLLSEYNDELEELLELENEITVTNFTFNRELLKSKQENDILRLEKEANKKSLTTYKVSGFIMLLLTIGMVIIAIRANKRKREKALAVTQLKETASIKDGLLEIISHDLRSPLSSLAGLVNLSNQNLLKSDDAKPLFTMLESTMDKSLSLADNLLIWSKIQSNEVKLSDDKINLEQNINNIAKVYNSLATSKQVTINISVNHTNTAMADAFMINLIIRNIIGLSVANTKPNGSINIITVDSDGDTVEVVIENILSNLDFEKVKTWKIRAPFGKDIRDKKRSAGLGLFVANEYLSKIKSELVISKLENGLSYRFKLPVHTKK